MTAGRIPVARPRLPTAVALAPYLARIDAARIYSNFGPLASELESRLAVRHGVGTANVVTAVNATVGLALGLAASGARRGGYCAMPSWTFFATPHAARLAGLEPYFVDVDPGDWRMTPAHLDALPAAVSARVTAAMPVMPFGAACDLGQWDDWSRARGVPVVVDAAAAFDTLEPGAALAVVSLHATKVLGAGEGAYVVTRDAELAMRFRRMSGFGIDPDRVVRRDGTNAKLSEYAAAVALAGLDEWNQTRAAWVARRAAWHDALDGVPARMFPFDRNTPFASSTLVVQLDRDVEPIQRDLAALGVETRRWWNAGCAEEPAFAACPRADLPATRAVARASVGLPMHLDLPDADIERAATALRQTLEK